MLWLWNLHLGVARKWPRGAWCQLEDLWHLNHSQSQLSKIIFKKRALTKKSITAGSWKLHSQVSLQTICLPENPHDFWTVLFYSSNFHQQEYFVTQLLPNGLFKSSPYLGGGFIHIFYFQPELWGRWTHFDEHIFQMGWFNHQRVLFRKPWVHRCLPVHVAEVVRSSALTISCTKPLRRWTWATWLQSSSGYGCFLKRWHPTTMGFPTKNDHFGVFWG